MLQENKINSTINFMEKSPTTNELKIEPNQDFQPTASENLQVIDIEQMTAQPALESLLADELQIYTGTKMPVFPIVTTTGELVFNALKLNEKYCLKDEYTVNKIEGFENIKANNVIVKMLMDRRKKLHINKIIGMELDSLELSCLVNLDELISKRGVNSNDCILMNKEDFSNALLLKDNMGRKLVNKIEGKFIYNGNIEIKIIPISKPTLIDLGNLYIREIGNYIEVKNDASIIRAGKRVWSLNYDYGVGIANINSVFQCNNL